MQLNIKTQSSNFLKIKKKIKNIISLTAKEKIKEQMH